jgi:hypothetical protein
MRFALCAVVALLVGASGAAAADPTPQPPPGYQIAGPSGPQFPDTQVYPPRCLAAMLACGFRYDPATGHGNREPTSKPYPDCQNDAAAPRRSSSNGAMVRMSAPMRS